MNWHFDQPWMLLLATLALPLCAWGWRVTRTMDMLRRTTIIGVRGAFIIGLALLLARPHIAREHHHLTVIGLVDVSASVRRFANLPDDATLTNPSTVAYLRSWFQRSVMDRQDDDRFGLIAFDGEAIAVSIPSREAHLDDALEVIRRDGTNIDDAIGLGLAMFPADTARRLVLLTDGNETSGNALEAARQAAADVAIDDDGNKRGVPIDIVAIEYEAPSDVQVERIEVPPNAQPGQTVTVRMLLHSSRVEGSLTGRLILKHEGAFVDLNGSAEGWSRTVDVPPGHSVVLAQVPLLDSPVNRFEAFFEPDNPADDVLTENNTAEAFTATPSKGDVLIIDNHHETRPNVLASFLRAADLPVQLQTAIDVPRDLLQLQQFDLIVLDNIASTELSAEQHELFSRFVNDLGGGLIMIGGEHSFGAGGWKGTPVADVLPLELDPPKELILPTAAVVLVLDRSGSMLRPVGGARATQQEVANEGAALAIESLRTDTLVGVVAFDSSPDVIVELQRNDDPRALADDVRAIQANGGTNMGPALEQAANMLRQTDVQRRRIICLSDGQSTNPDALPKIAARLLEQGIRVTSIAVGDDADVSTLQAVANEGGGEFYLVRNPKVLPRVLVDSVQILNKPLIKEGPFIPVVHATGSALARGLNAGRPLGGLVVTGPREDAPVTLEMSHPDGEPLLAHWQAGLGRVAAFTSDVDGNWSKQWANWDTASAFWVQLARMITRAPMPRDAEMRTRLEDGRLHVEMIVPTQDDGPRYLTVAGTVYRPDGRRQAITLRQVAPDRYEANLDAELAGNYIVALTPREGTKPMAPLIGGVSQTSSRELRLYESNLELLQQIRELTGGRSLPFESPQDVELFDRTDLPRTRSLVAIWQTLACVLLGVLLLDVATRRVAWNAATVGNLARRALRQTAPATEKAERAARTMDELKSSRPKKTKQRQSSRRKRSPADVTFSGQDSPTEARSEQGVKKETSAAQVRKKKQVDTAAVHSALDQILKPTKPKPNTPAKDNSPQDDDADASPEQTTSSLLEARRRARRERGE